MKKMLCELCYLQSFLFEEDGMLGNINCASPGSVFQLVYHVMTDLIEA